MSRPEKAAELIRAEVSKILRAKVSDPRVGFVSITSVDVSPDLENAAIYVSIFGGEKDKVAAMAGLDSATRFIRGELGRRIEFRQVPQIRFVRDDSLEKGSNVLGIINKLHKDEKTVRPSKRAPKKS
ncbi:MAG: 30S ribosome-binding factor RbfA [bacterium]